MLKGNVNIIGSGKDINLALSMCDMGYENRILYAPVGVKSGVAKVGYGFEKFGIRMLEELPDFKKDDLLIFGTNHDLVSELIDSGFKVFQTVGGSGGKLRSQQGLLAGFYNGSSFQSPTLKLFSNVDGGLLIWNDGEKTSIPILNIQNYKGAVSDSLDNTWIKIAFKMIQNLDEVLDKTVLGEDSNMNLEWTHAYYINAFKPENKIGFVELKDIYKLEQKNPEKWAITFDEVFMDSDGLVYSLPDSNIMFQMIGFGNSYEEAVKNCLDLRSSCKRRLEFIDRKQELVEDIRDRYLMNGGN